MRPLLYLATFAAVMGLAFWAYHENYATTRVLKDMSNLQSEIADLREALAVQRAEWAYLNRPDRLRELTAINFDRLGLLPLEPEQFGNAAQLAYPVPEMAAINQPVDVIGDQEANP
ncbi:MAG: cell division protein FtsL [Paracoccaceae bacterium]|nr:cell division protein FtsL [Paracoccaceae bacterium]